MSPVAINGVDKQGVYVNGVQVEQALDAANETVNKGVYSATTLSAVDADLQAANIKLAETIFGHIGMVAPGGVETITRHSTGNLASNANYTPAVSGIFATMCGLGGWGGSGVSVQYYSDAEGSWWNLTSSGSGQTAIGDGTNFRIRNNSGATNYDYALFRHYYSTGTYERLRDLDLAGGATYTPAVTGYFALVGEVFGPTSIYMWANANGTWYIFREVSDGTNNKSATIVIGEGTNLRVKNSAGGALNYVLMHQKLT